MFHVLVVQRVHWLRGRAQKCRWEEEVILVQYEMEWTVRYFLNNMTMWEDRSTACSDRGAAAYAARKAAMWHSMALQAEDQFSDANNSYQRSLPTR